MSVGSDIAIKSTLPRKKSGSALCFLISFSFRTPSGTKEVSNCFKSIKGKPKLLDRVVAIFNELSFLSSTRYLIKGLSCCMKFALISSFSSLEIMCCFSRAVNKLDCWWMPYVLIHNDFYDVPASAYISTAPFADQKLRFIE